jgi:hypothetical protein
VSREGRHEGCRRSRSGRQIDVRGAVAFPFATRRSTTFVATRFAFVSVLLSCRRRGCRCPLRAPPGASGTRASSSAHAARQARAVFGASRSAISAAIAILGSEVETGPALHDLSARKLGEPITRVEIDEPVLRLRPALRTRVHDLPRAEHERRRRRDAQEVAGLDVAPGRQADARHADGERTLLACGRTTGGSEGQDDEREDEPLHHRKTYRRRERSSSWRVPLGSAIRPIVPRHRPRVTALIAVLALLLAAPYERQRDCTVCPVDCPMHAARKAAARMGCHHGGSTPQAAHPAEHGACAMRASCGHHGGTLPVFTAELSPPATVTIVTDARPVALPDRPIVTADDPAPPHRPPEPSVV